ncbi:MAG: UvrD-helicase domain-containing protein [Clostridia bacterium]|nr:UvrD-helicase domain-containing protein [Clostridia bacterium]
MATNWTKPQETAINTYGKTLLVSAAAGSGKTATLTERIIRSLMKEDGLDISRMLIVTYTRAAAAELKVKISKALASALSENPQNHRLAEQMMMLESAKICTIDSFYFDIVKSNFARLGLSGSLRIVDSAEMTLLYKSEMETLIEDFYATREGFTDFMDHFVPVRGADQSADIFLSIYQNLLSYQSGVDKLGEYVDNLKSAASAPFLSSNYGASVKSISRISLEYAINVLETACDFFASAEDARMLNNYGPAFMNDLRVAKETLDAINNEDYKKATQVLGGYEKLSLKVIRGEKDEYTSYLQELRKEITALLEGLKKDYFLLPEDEVSSLIFSTAEVVSTLYDLLLEFDKRLNKEKQERGICDFSDIRRYVLKLLIDENGNPTDIAKDYRARFDEIYIDEYQDVDEMQDNIFSAISTPTNRFMVGDIKQSIYGFRGASSDVFARYKATFPRLGENAPDADAYSIFMSNNFRCDQNVIDFSNLVSSYLFTNFGDSIGYRKEDDLIFSKPLPYEDYVSPKVTLALTGITEDLSAEEKKALKEETKEEKIYYEAEYIVAEISRLLSSETKADGTRIQPRDIAILMRQNTDIEAISDILTREGIPSQSVDRSDFFENPDILLMISLLSTIDNPRRDIPLAGTLRSPFYRFSFDELILIRKSAESSLSLYDALEQYATSGDSVLSQKCGDFISSLSYWREKATILPVDKLIQKLYREFSILSLAKDNPENLIRLYEYARSFEANSFHGLYSFIAYLDELIESGAQLQKNGEGAESNAVHLITMHHSKGLEYPVCFLYGMGKQFSCHFKSNRIQFEPSLGLGLLLHDQTGFAYSDTPVRRAIIDKRVLKDREEEMRVLYVAMTRARERLYLTATVPSPEKLENKVRSYLDFGKAYGIYSSSSYLEWIFSAIKTGAYPDCYCIEKYNAFGASVEETEPIPSIEMLPIANEDAELSALFEKRFSFVYPYAHTSSLPAKLSVSSLYPALLDESEMTEIDPATLKDAFVYPEGLLQTDRASGAEKGTATHTFLQFCDFDLVLHHGVKEELARLQTERFIDARTARLCNVYQLEQFFKSELFERIRCAKEVYREQRFHIFLPASEFTQMTEKAELLKNETIAVQGVIDIFFRDQNGDIVLVDYKTDFLTAEELEDQELAAIKLKERHGEQLAYYQKAIEKICGKSPSETLIYSLPLAKAIRL